MVVVITTRDYDKEIQYIIICLLFCLKVLSDAVSLLRNVYFDNMVIFLDIQRKIECFDFTMIWLRNKNKFKNTIQ